MMIVGGTICPVCFEGLEQLEVDLTRPTVIGIGGNIILCTACASLVVVTVKHWEGSKDPRNVLVTLRPMTKAEKMILRQDPTAHLMKQAQEELAFIIGGSD